jgi:hypothetical protein
VIIGAYNANQVLASPHESGRRRGATAVFPSLRRFSMRIAFLALPLGLLAVGVAAHDASAAGTRSYAAGAYVVQIDGAGAGWVTKVAGGGATADVVLERAGQTGSYPKKHPGPVKFEDITFAVHGAMDRPLHDWVKQTLAAASSPAKEGAILTVDFNNKEQSRMAWKGGVISDFSFPELDGSSKDPALMFVTVTPQSTKISPGSGALVSDAVAQKAKSAKVMAANFRLAISGLEAAMPSVSHIDPMSVRFTQITSPVGATRDYERTPGKVDVSNLVFTVLASKAAPVIAWHDDFVVRGNNGDARERSGSIEVLGADLKTVVYRLNMKGIGILRYGPDASSVEGTPKLRFECYVESVSLD